MLELQATVYSIYICFWLIDVGQEWVDKLLGSHRFILTTTHKWKNIVVKLFRSTEGT